MMFAHLKQSVGFSVCLLGLFLVGIPAGEVWAEPICKHPEIEKQFMRQFQEINRNIRMRQEILKQKINDPVAPEEQIMKIQLDLSHWKAKRDTLAIDYILRVRRDHCPPNSDLSPLNR